MSMQAYYNKSLLPVLSHLITPYAALRDEEGAESRIRFVENKHVVQMRVPKPYIDREYRVRSMPLDRHDLALTLLGSDVVDGAGVDSRRAPNRHLSLL